MRIDKNLHTVFFMSPTILAHCDFIWNVSHGRVKKSIPKSLLQSKKTFANVYPNLNQKHFTARFPVPKKLEFVLVLGDKFVFAVLTASSIDKETKKSGTWVDT